VKNKRLLFLFSLNIKSHVLFKSNHETRSDFHQFFHVNTSEGLLEEVLTKPNKHVSFLFISLFHYRFCVFSTAVDDKHSPN